MKGLTILFLVCIAWVHSLSQDKNDFLVIFFVNQFSGDSVHVLLDNKTVSKLKLTTDPSTGQCDELAVVKLTDKRQELTICEVQNKKNHPTEIRKGFKYLYIFKLTGNNYRFDFSNKLSLPE